MPDNHRLRARPLPTQDAGVCAGRPIKTWEDLKTILLQLGIRDDDTIGGIIFTEGDSFHVVIEMTDEGRKFSVLPKERGE